MLAKLRTSVTYANVMATVAVFVALGGTSYAVATGSIDSRELKNNSVRSKDLRDNEVRSKDIRNSSLLAQDFKAGELSAGPTGPRGIQGEKGDPGTPGATNVVVRKRTGTALSQGSFFVFNFQCQAGERATGAGAGLSGNQGNEEIQQSYPLESDGSLPEEGDTPTGWLTIIKNNNASSLVPSGYIVCARP